MFEIILCLIFAIAWIILQYMIIQGIMIKVPDGNDRYELIIYLLLLNVAALMCGVLLGLINC